MADAYSYALLVELEENSVPKLKNKLVKYFQSKKSKGGDCEVEYVNGSRTAVLRFRTEEDQKNVLAKASHQIPLDKGVLKMTVCLITDDTTTQEAPSGKLNKKSDVAVKNKQTDEPTPAAEVKTEGKGGDDETADEELSSTTAVLGNIPQSLSQDFLEMLVENILKDQNYTLEFIPDISSAVVTFQSGKETTDFVTRCPQNRTFKNKGLSVQALEVTKQVVVDDVGNLTEDLLCLYFDKEGEVENVALNEVEQSAIITFKDHKAVKEILKKKHQIKHNEIRVYPFYESLGTALYGKDKPSPKLPATISEPIDSAVWKYLNDNQSAAESIRSHLTKHFCNVNLNKPTVLLSPESSLLQQKDAIAIIKEWRDTVKSAFAQALSKFKSLKLQPESELWDESEEKIRKAVVNEDVVVVSDKANGVLSVVGLVDNVNKLQQTLCESMNKIAKKAQREKSSTTQNIKVSQSIYNILCQDGLEDKLQDIYPDLKMSFTKDSPDLMVTGLNDEIMKTKQIICDAIFDLKRQHLEIDKNVLDLLKDEQQEKLTEALLTSNGINAAFEIKAQKVRLIAASDKDLNDAEDHLVKLLISQCIDVEDSDVLKKPEWEHLVGRLEKANNKSYKRIRIHTTSQQVVVSGHKDDVISVSRDLNSFLKQNAHVEETVVVKSNTIVRYIEKRQSSGSAQLNDKVAVSYRKDAICLSGSRGDVTPCKTRVENLVSSLSFDRLNICKPGMKKFFQDNEKSVVSSILNETGCQVQLVDETSGGQGDLGQRQITGPVYQLQTTEGVEIAVCKADMCRYPVQAVVSAFSEDLKLKGGLAAALLKAAGPQLQNECDKQIKKGQLKPGDCVITGAGGQLCCNKVIHAVVPKFDSKKVLKVQAQLKKAVKLSLELAEKHGCISVALPTIGISQGFPHSLCADTIIKAVKEYLDEKYDDISLKTIHFVDSSDSAVKVMEAAVRHEFGSHGVSQSPHVKHAGSLDVSHSLQTLSSQGTKSLPMNCLGQAQTNEGLHITIMKGNIQHATTEVTVNSVSEDLDLNKGAVSNAIFGVAGAKLQQLVNAKNASGSFGEVIVTEGCKLKSKQVFHAVTPHWDNGQGTADKILKGIFKDCLDRAEDTGLTSISFPAIGTGNLNFPKDLVASLMLDEILAFSSKSQPKLLKEIVIILYPGDPKTIQVFSDEFQKKFPNASGVPVPTSSPQSKGVFSKVVSSSGMYETKMGSVVIQAVTGDITKETTDVIVNSSNESFSLKSGVSKAILEAAGSAVEDECKELSAQPNPGMIMTQPGNLKCKQILHIAGQSDPVKINTLVKDALQMCVTNSHTSVSLPAIGTGQGGAQAGKVADAMLDGVIEVLSQNPSSTLNTIRIVIFQSTMLKDFYNSMQQREATDPKNKAPTLWGRITSGVKSLFVASTDKPKKAEDFIVIETVKVDPACFHICGESQAKVDLAKQQINDLISQEQNSMSISDNAIRCLSDANCKRIVDIQKTMNVSIKTESQKDKPSIIIDGLTKDVFKASKEIHEMISDAREKEDLRKNVAEWQFQQGSSFQSFNPETNYELEQAFDKKIPTVKVSIQGQIYKVDTSSGLATDNQGCTLELKRIDKTKDEDIPLNWDPMPANTTSQAFPITAGTAEYTEVEKLFMATWTQPIIKIERIQNLAMWKALQIKKMDMEKRNGHQNNERRLFHGTAHDAMAHINDYGFDRGFAGKNAACYGNGTYFAVEASYSARDTYSKPHNGEKFMYLCRVLTGDFTLGKQDIITAPAKDSTGIQKFDSVVDNMAKPNMFVIFHDSQAYPEYLITFKQ
ncbi:poly(ADP-ribose) polymerase family member 14-related sequence 1 isoform X2 [Pagrus major]|uniref:poly(ADP-ribose) polymerase family member 14-related sequence 1 isoform X2 n=1 Tax=Pagrus major TaxID=143350 RepID=UPI003CC87192